ncbi:uncharacterized protein METZ01_LOCUS405202, partial [marine metagenome]
GGAGHRQDDHSRRIDGGARPPARHRI